MSWINAPKEAPKDKIGFVYEITELNTGMKYIGQTKMWKINKKKPGKYKKDKEGNWVRDKEGKRVLNTTTRKKHTKVETNWREYNSSSPLLQEKMVEGM